MLASTETYHNGQSMSYPESVVRDVPLSSVTRSARCNALHVVGKQQTSRPGSAEAYLTMLKWPVSADRSIFCFSWPACLSLYSRRNWDDSVPPSAEGGTPLFDAWVEAAVEAILRDMLWGDNWYNGDIRMGRNRDREMQEQCGDKNRAKKRITFDVGQTEFDWFAFKRHLWLCCALFTSHRSSRVFIQRHHASSTMDSASV